MATGNRFTLSAHTVEDRFRHFGWQVDLLDTHVNNFNTQRRHTVRVHHRHFTVGFSLNALRRFSDFVIRRWRCHFVYRTRRTGVQRVTHFQRQAATRVGHDIFDIQATNFRTQTVRELTFQQYFRLRDVTAARRQEVTAEIADPPLDVRVDNQVFLLFGHETIGLVIHRLDTRVHHFN